jgi:hypothetical protein
MPLRGAVLSKFIPSLQDNSSAAAFGETVFYHCIPVTPYGDAILPSANYGATIPADVCAKLDIAAGEQTPHVFAATHLTKALAFGLIGRDGEKLLNAAVQGSDRELVVICDREKTMQRERDITVYAIPAKGFEILPHMERQAVSPRAVPFADAAVTLRAKNAEDLMRAGLQIFSFRESFADLAQDRDAEDLRQTNDFPRSLADLVRSGKVVWENHSRGVNPDPVLAAQMGVQLKPSASPAKPAVPHL